MRGTLEQRFWAKVDKRGPDECWPWLGKPDHDGYGRIREGGKDTQSRPAHRISWEIANGQKMPADKLACHSCSTAICVNPKHIYPGTYLDNGQDCARAGREKEQRGSKHALTKLTEADVLAMRTAVANGEATGRALALRYGIRESTVSYILAGKTWQHVPMPPRKTEIERIDLATGSDDL